MHLAQDFRQLSDQSLSESLGAHFTEAANHVPKRLGTKLAGYYYKTLLVFKHIDNLNDSVDFCHASQCFD